MKQRPICLLGQAERARREQDLHHDRRLVAHLPAADRQRPARPAAGGRRRSARRLADRARTGASRARGVRRLVHARRRAGSAPRPSAARASTSSASGAPTTLISAPAKPGPGDLGARAGERVLRMRLDQPLARDDLREHDLRRAAGDGVDACRARSRTTYSHGIVSQPEPPGERHAGDDERRASARRRCRPAACARGRARRPTGSENSTKGSDLHRASAGPSASGVACSSTAAVSGSASIVTCPPSELIRIDVHRRR